MSAFIMAVKNVCSRVDPTRQKDYTAAMGMLVGEEREAFQEALKSPLFPSALKAVEDKLNALSKDKIARECSAYLRH